MAAERSFGPKHFMTSAWFPTSGMKQKVWSTDSSNIYIYIYIYRQMYYLNYSDSSNSPFAIKRKVSRKCVSCFPCKNLCFMGCPLFTKQELYIRKICPVEAESFYADRQTGQTRES